MSNPVLLDNISHKKLKIKTQRSAEFGFDVSATRIFPVEFRQAQSEYPLFFKKDSETGQFECIALLGFEKSENLYLDSDEWLANYLPLSIERQPFLIGFQETIENGVPLKNPVVHIDLDHPCVNESSGQSVFTEQGGQTDYLQRISSVLMTIHQGHQQSQHFAQQLSELNLLEAVALDLKFDDDSAINLQGLYTVNEAELAKLTGEQLEQLHRSGHLQSIYMLIASASNIQGLMNKKNQKLKIANQVA